MYWILEKVGIVLAISPALEGLAAILSFLTNPFALAIFLLVIGGAAVAGWYRVDDVGTVIVEGLARCKEWLIKSPVVVRGSLEQGGVRWVGHHTRDGVTNVEHRACLRCAVELEQEPTPHTEVDRPNTPIEADKETRERETKAWENVFEQEKADPEEYIEALVCPRETCRFSIRGEKYVKSGESAARKQLRAHFDRMRAGGSDPFGKWHRRAGERLDYDLDPTPADLWDAYARECNDDEAVMQNQSFGQGLPDAGKSVTCPALEKHKADAEGVDQLIERAPDGFDKILAWLARSGYLEKRREITRKMNEEEEKCSEKLQSVEQNYGTTIEQVLNDRYNREEPEIDLKSAEHRLDTANETVRELRDTLDFYHLSSDKRRWLSASTNSVADAFEYVRELRAFNQHRGEIKPTIDGFEERFEPYSEGENYMITPDQEFLEQGCSTICQQLTDLHREVQLELLPLEMTEWAENEKARFTELSRRLPAYNEEFVERDRERFADLFETEHGPLNDEQQKAIVRNDLHNLVDASAGTGKTLTLTYRFQYLYQRGIPLDDIVAITFTNDATNEMEKRIADALDGVSRDDLNISTFHSLAQSIVEDSIIGSIDDDWDEKAARKRYVEGFIDGSHELESRHPEPMESFKYHHDRFIRSDEDYIKDTKSSRETNYEFFARKYGEFIKKARDFDQTPDEIRKQLTKANRTQYHFGQAGCAILEAYIDRARSTDEPVDYHDMIKSATRLGQENPEYFSGEYRHILFDEFQDVSEPILEFIETFLEEPEDTHLFAVGDDWQSIYGFRGSDPRYFTEFDDRFDGTEHTQLAINYRCPPTIVEAGAELMAHSEEQQNEKAVEAFSGLPEIPVMHKLGGISESRVGAHAADLVEKTLHEDGIDPADIMILSRTKDSLWDVTSPLDKRGILRTEVNEPDDDGVQLLTIHQSKGTEAECVILLNATDGTPNGLPSSDKTDELLEPAIANTVDYSAEERRLCYVALTRSERYFHAITDGNNVSKYLKDIDEFFEERRSNVWTPIGIPGPWDPPEPGSDQPFETTFACEGYTVTLKTWDEAFTQKLDPGQRYRLSNFEATNEGFGEEIRLNESVEVKPLDAEESSTAES
ncbi:UvrD-helicase domain-containing protein [Halocatena marina]|uniref:UvrD-helicase domain-containing protein n=1 Tax=Halocatena marina TaxID=2934937 RepID=UPI00200D1378|nr:UvrD-helicase domain-containing protein [Halocatena marina]